MPNNVPGQGTFGCATGGSQQGFAVWGGDSFTCGVDDGVEYQGDMGCKVNNLVLLDLFYVMIKMVL